MQNLIKRFKKVGWSKRDITKAIKIIKESKQNKPDHVKFLDKRIYWILLVVAVAANFAISISLVPILIALRGIFLYLIIIVFGIMFGLLFELVIRSIEHLESKHHMFLSILIPLIALGNIFSISKISNNLAKTLNLNTIHNPLITALIYAASFVMPYIVYRFILKIEYYAKE